MKNPVLERLQQYGLRPRKDLGQHFLIDLNVLERLVQAVQPGPDMVIVEFGAGLGVLTERFLDAGARVVAVELDDELAHVLREQLGGRQGFKLVHGDLARLDLPAVCHDMGVSRIKLAGNLPYQLTSRVLFGLLELREQLDDAVFMVQREVAERIVAAPGSRDYGILSVLLRAYHDVELVMRVKRGGFTPVPRVDSALLRIVPRGQGPALPWTDCAGLVHLVKSVFNERRKVLRNTLKKFYELDADPLAQVAQSSGIDLGRRPETLGVEEFVRLLHAVTAVTARDSRSGTEG